MIKDFYLKDGDPPFFKSRLFESYGVKHAFFTRLGGVSADEFASLNFASGAGEKKDDEQNVFKNYELAANVFGLRVSDVCRSYQTHTAIVERATEDDRGRGIVSTPYDHGVDGVFTTEKNLLLSVRTADCVPVLICDKSKTICAAIHAGWRGTAGGITLNALREFNSLGVKNDDILVSIGPCIGQCCYEVGEEVRDEFMRLDKGLARHFKPTDGKTDKFLLDLTGANAYLLESFGLPKANVSAAGICTKCHPELFFSHRRDGSVRGTMGAFVTI